MVWGDRGSPVIDLRFPELSPGSGPGDAPGRHPASLSLSVLRLVGSLLVALCAAGAPLIARATSDLVEYTDNKYGYGFQFPSDWQFQDPPPRDAAGETRVVVRSPRGERLTVTVGNLGTVLSRTDFQLNPKSAEVTEAIIDLTIEHVYKKRSLRVGAGRMIVVERRAIPNESGLIFYINTAHSLEDESLAIVTGIHAVPFDKSHLISFVMSGHVDPNAERSNAIFHEVFQSFRLIGPQTPSGN
jgi:hypothetical protein